MKLKKLQLLVYLPSAFVFGALVRGTVADCVASSDYEQTMIDGFKAKYHPGYEFPSPEGDTIIIEDKYFIRSLEEPELPYIEANREKMTASLYCADGRVIECSCGEQ